MVNRLHIVAVIFFTMLIVSCTGTPSGSTKSASESSPSPSPPMASPSRTRSADAASGSSVVSTSKPAPSSGGRGSHAPQSGILTAGEIDDNLNLGAFKRYMTSLGKKLRQFQSVTHGNNVHLQVVDATGRGVSNAQLKISGRTYYTRTDGHFYFYPAYEAPQSSRTPFLSVGLVADGRVVKTLKLDTTKNSLHKLTLPSVQNTLPKALDLMFVIDATGSMGDELRYIKAELKSIIGRVKRLHPATDIRYGLVVYRDKGDEYVVRSYPFQSSLSKMEGLLAEQQANGGGDYPEAMDAALEKAVQANWGKGNRARVMFLIADAPPHAEGINKALQAAKIAHEKGIRIYPVGASGVADKAEYVMRHVALISNGRYQFLTDDSGVGNSHQEPHVACYVVTRLDQLMIRTISTELSGRRVEPSRAEIMRQVGDYDNGVCKLTQSVHKTN